MFLKGNELFMYQTLKRYRWIIFASIVVIALTIMFIDVFSYKEFHIRFLSQRRQELEELIEICSRNNIRFVSRDNFRYGADESEDVYYYQETPWFIASRMQLKDTVCKKAAELMNILAKNKIKSVSWTPEQNKIVFLIEANQREYQFVGLSNLYYFKDTRNVDEAEILIRGDFPEDLYKIVDIIRINKHWWRINFKGI